MNYKERLNFIKSKIDKTEDKSKLKSFLDSIKTSDLKPEEKGKLIEEIEYRLTGRRYTDGQILKDIEDSQADLDDLN